MKNKKLLYAMVSILSVVVMLAVFFIIWFWGDSYGDFSSKIFDTEFDIPDLDAGATPQGIAAYSANEFTIKGKTNDDGTTTPDAKYAKDNYFFVSAYMSKGPSRVYVIGEEQGLIGYVTFINTPNKVTSSKDSNGHIVYTPAEGEKEPTAHTGHVGGVAINRDNIWVASTKADENGNDIGVIYVAQASSSYTYLYQEVIDKAAKSKTGGDNTIEFTSYFNAQGANDFLYYYNYNNSGSTTSPSTNDRLYAGEFARTGDKKYEKHHLTTPVIEPNDTNGEPTGEKKGGDRNHAFVYEYNVYSTYTGSEYKTGLYHIDENTVKSESGYQVPKIQYIYSVPDDIQGFARTNDGKLVLSQSYSLKNSKLYYYDWDKVSNKQFSIKNDKGDTIKNFKLVDNKKYYTDDTVGGKRFEYQDVKFASGARYTVSDLQVYFADSSSLERVYDVPSMSEGLCTLTDGNGEQRVYVLFESGAKKYRTFVRQILTNVYSFVPNKYNY